MAEGRPFITKREFGLSRTSIKQLAGLLLICGLGEQDCAGCAAPKAFAATSAQVAPLSKHLPRRRRRLRRYQSICRGIGAGCAATKAFAATSAQVAPLSKHLPRHRREFPQVSRHLPWHRREFPQVSRHLPWHRREFPQVSRHLPRRRRRLRRYQSICRDVGAGCATPKAFAATSAGVPASLPAFAVASAEKSADRLFAERDCLRRTHVN